MLTNNNNILCVHDLYYVTKPLKCKNTVKIIKVSAFEINT